MTYSLKRRSFTIRLSPGEHRSTPVVLHLEVHSAFAGALQGMEPHHLRVVVEDYRATLSGTALLRGDEDVAGGGIVRLNGYLDGGGAKLRA